MNNLITTTKKLGTMTLLAVAALSQATLADVTDTIEKTINDNKF